ncbi:MAG: tetratricopeptide repeat protein [Rhodanobacteraceae bacterium]|nr:MAG: tetratricopeptide repeat protein [Rhodanobacteraceae bacterium]
MNTIPAALLSTMHQVNDLLQRGDFRTAHARLETIVREHPDFVEAQRLLAGTKLALGDTDGAEALLRRAIALDPEWTPTLTMLGEWLLNAGKYAEAEQFLRRAAGAQAADPRAALILARHWNDRRRHADALAIAAPFGAAGKAAPELAIQHVIALAGLGRADEAVAFYRRRADDSPDDPAAAHALAIALQATHADAEAERTAGHAAARGYRNASLSYTHARSLVALGAFERAEAALRDCLRMEPQHTEAHAELARLVWIQCGDGAQATALLDEVLKKFPGNDALWAVKAAVLQGAGDPRAAYACLAPRSERAHAPPALLLRAGLAALEFDSRVALDLASRVLRKLPGDTAAMKLLAAACLGVGNARETLTLCDALLAQAPDDQYLIALQTTAWRMAGDERYGQLCDYKTLVVPYRLDTPAPWRSLDDFLDDLKRSLGKLHDAFRHRLLFQSLRHGTETTGDLTRSADPVVQALFKAFDAPIRDYLARVGHGDDPLRRRNANAYRFSGSWSVRLQAPGFHRNHVHPNGWISSACYIDLPGVMHDTHTREGTLTFAEPGILTTPTLSSQHEVRPVAGTLVLFPSYFWHGTVPFSGDQPRLTVAFDAVPVTRDHVG